MNLKNILWVRNTGKIMPSASVQENLFGLKLSGGGGGVITTATGNPVSIVTNKAQNAIDLQIAFSPKQSGSGTPSPDNIRPLVPWTALGLSVCKKNLIFNYTCNYNVFGLSGSVIDGSGGGVRFTGVPTWTSGNKDFRIANAADVFNRYGNDVRIEIFCDSPYVSLVSWRVDSNGVIILRANPVPTTENITIDFYIFMYLDEKPTQFEPYTGSEESYSLGDSYNGGTLDVVTGELTVTHISIAFSDIPSADWRYSDNSGNWDNYLFFANIADRKNATISMCSSYNFVTGTEAKVPSDSYILPTWNKYLYIRDDRFTSIEDFLAARGNERFVYELAEPITVSLTPAEVALLAGNNTLATDGDSLTVTYMAKK